MSIESDTNEPSSGDTTRVSSELQKVLNQHGFSFQYAVVRRAEELSKLNTAHLRLEGTEIPVGKAGDSTHIDFVMQSVGRWQRDHNHVYVLGECKRVDPAKARWCFVKSPYTWRNPYQTNGSTQFDEILWNSESERFEGRTKISYTARPVLELSFELRTGTKGDGTAVSGKSEISNAVAQVLRGLKGYIQYATLRDALKTHKEKIGERAIFIPAIFTTAEIFVSNSNVSQASLSDGKLGDLAIRAEPADWIWFNYNRSISLAHEIWADLKVNSEYDHHFLDFSRSIAIVGPTGIDSFMQTDFDSWLR